MFLVRLCDLSARCDRKSSAYQPIGMCNLGLIVKKIQPLKNFTKQCFDEVRVEYSGVQELSRVKTCPQRFLDQADVLSGRTRYREMSYKLPDHLFPGLLELFVMELMCS